MFNYEHLTPEQLEWLEQHGASVSAHMPLQYLSDQTSSAFTGPVREHYPDWLEFLSSKKQTKCLHCKKFMPKTPQEMVAVISHEWHVHIECLGHLIDSLIEKEEVDK